MKSADTATGYGSSGITHAGPGCLVTFMCSGCHKPRPQQGRRKTRLGYVCGGCAATLTQRRYVAAKQAWAASHPSATPAQYEQACQDIAGRLGI